MRNAYSAIAGHYDSLMTDFDYSKYYEFSKCYATGKVLELACGSGTFTAFLLRSADSVVAVDSSVEMLNIARERNYRERRSVTFVQSSMTEYECMHRVNNVFAVCDGLNYIDGEDLERLAVRVNRSMRSGGRFVFDISSAYKLRQVIGNNIFYEDNDDITYLWTNSLYEDRVEMELAVFERDGDIYHRSDEEHTQYIHECGDVTAAMEKGGFRVEVYSADNFNEPKEDSLRLLFVCEKVREV